MSELHKSIYLKDGRPVCPNCGGLGTIRAGGLPGDRGFIAVCNNCEATFGDLTEGSGWDIIPREWVNHLPEPEELRYFDYTVIRDRDCSHLKPYRERGWYEKKTNRLFQLLQCNPD